MAPYNIRVSLGKSWLEVDRGSLSSIYRVMFFEMTNNLSGLILKIGAYCNFAVDVKILIGGSHLKDDILVNTFTESPHLRLLTNNKLEKNGKEILSIGSNVVVSEGVILLPGATVGDGTLIAAGSIVNGNHEQNSLIAGCPAKFVKYLQEPNFPWWKLKECQITNFFRNENFKVQLYEFDHIKLAMKGIVGENGKIVSSEFLGVYSNNKFYELAKLPKSILDYFSQSNSDGPVEIDDEIFIGID